ncbi:hypothetical protein [Paenibacillus rigui]|uniref:YolD-like family protein n=1 Tax=Paenibacillus rigui TaxID=554312 RepID=A0A229UN08_9BACL|nr:hypothetical protein [Paenibacillus rigui]OXM84279.1 hypothetical protein CF651_21075 [Paenibacillus rigui]
MPRELQKQTSPELMDEEREKLFGQLKAAKAHALEVTITYGNLKNRQVRGMVTGLDPRLHFVKVEANYDWRLIDFADVIKVELDHED